MHSKLACFGLAFAATVSVPSSSCAPVLSEFCGTIVSTPTCTPILEFDGGGYELLANDGGDQVGDRVRFVGEIVRARRAPAHLLSSFAFRSARPRSNIGPAIIEPIIAAK